MRQIVSPVITMLLVLGLLVGVACVTAAQPPATPTQPPEAAPRTPTPAVPAPAPTIAPAKPTPTPMPQSLPAGEVGGPEKPSYGGVIISVAEADPATYDPHQDTSIHCLGLAAPVYDRMIETEPVTGKLVPGLAERWEISPDGKTVTFYLRKGIKWHDGRPFTSADARATLEKIIWPSKGARSPRKITVGDAVSKLEAPDDYTLKAILERPRGSFIPAVASCWNVVEPKHVIDVKGDMGRDLIGTGPFKFKEHNRGVSWEVVRNPDYWVEGKPYVDGMVTYTVPDAASRLAAFRTRRTNLWYNSRAPTPADVASLTKQFGDQIWAQHSGWWGFGGIHFNMKRKPWDDIRVRKAVDLMVNREEALKIAFKSAGGAHHGIMGIEGPWGTRLEELLKRPGWRQPKDQDMAEAKRLMAEVKMEPDFKVSILTRRTVLYEDHAVYAKSVLDSLGFDATIRALEPGATLQALTTGDYDVTAYHYGYPLDDPDSVFGDFYITKGERVAPGYSNKKLDELFVKQSATIDFAERKKIVDEMIEIAFNDHSRAIFGSIEWYTVGWKEVRGWKQWSGFYNNLNMADVWIAR